jgi:2-oxo-hept-3-ene-1,7-dioate hydratase
MLTKDDHRKAAQLLMQAEKERKPMVQLSKTFPSITIEDSYAIQSLVNEAKVAAGAKVRGHKVGLTSKAMQQSSQIDEPDYGVLMDNMFYDDGAKIPHENFCVPRVEMELGFVLGKALKGPGVGLLEVLAATDWVVPSIEIIDARVQNPRKIFDTVADNGAAAAVVIGGRPVRPNDVDLRWVAGLMYRNEGIEESGVAAAVLGHPALGIAWLANKVGRFGTVLQPGHFTLSGSFIRPVWANKGDVLRADFGPLGSVAVQFT